MGHLNRNYDEGKAVNLEISTDFLNVRRLRTTADGRALHENSCVTALPTADLNLGSKGPPGTFLLLSFIHEGCWWQVFFF